MGLSELFRWKSMEVYGDGIDLLDVTLRKPLKNWTVEDYFFSVELNLTTNELKLWRDVDDLALTLPFSIAVSLPVVEGVV